MNSLPSADLDHIIDHSAGLWEPLRKQRVFLTGGTGFFGKWLVAAFNRANQEFALQASLVVLTRDPQSARSAAPDLYAQPGITLHEGDFCSFQFPSGEFPFILHAATQTDSFTSPIPRGFLYDANVAGTRRVLALAEAAQVQRLLNVSSGAVYGPQPLDILHVREDCPSAPHPSRVDLAYGHSKRAAEFLVAAHAQEFKYTACHARCFAFVGPYIALDTNFAIGNFIGDALAGHDIRIKGDGTPLRSYLYMADLAIWLWTILLRGDDQSTYNVGSDAPVSISALAHKVAKIVNPACRVSVAVKPNNDHSPARYVPSIDKARAELGLAPWVSLDESIERTAQWYRTRR